jgi:hypothetical protein
VIADVPIGLVVVHVRLTLQLLALARIVHVGEEEMRVPDIDEGVHSPPIHVSGAVQLAVTGSDAMSVTLFLK